MNKKEKQQIKYLLENLKWYSEATNEQDYNGEYEPPMEWEQGEAKIFLKYLKEKDKEIERLNNRIKELEEGFKATTEDLCETAEELEKTNNKIKMTLDYIQNAEGNDINYIATLLLGYPVEIEEKRKQVLEVIKSE